MLQVCPQFGVKSHFNLLEMQRTSVLFDSLHVPTLPLQSKYLSEHLPSIASKNKQNLNLFRQLEESVLFYTDSDIMWPQCVQSN